MDIDWKNYNAKGFYDELITPRGAIRPQAKELLTYLDSLSTEEIRERQRAADAAIVEMGITFTVYSEGENIDRSWPYDIIPRIIDSGDWDTVDAGLRQRVQALNMFIADIYDQQKVVKDGVFPAELLANSVNFRKECVGIKPPHGVWAHICGSDLIRDHKGRFLVLEDNLRVPSGVSYMMENRVLTKRVFGELLENSSIRPVSDYPTQLFDMLAAISPRPLDYPEVVVLTPGIFNSAYFEHSFLAQHMGAELVEGADLVVGDDDCVYMRTIDGLQRVDVIYRRIDDLFLDPEVFREDSALGVPGLMRAWRAGNVGLANAPGAGVADDKVVYAFVPEFIRYYLDQEPLLPNVDTYVCYREKECEHVLANLDKLVVKPANESGGYGMLIGPTASKKERAEFARRIKADPRNYIAQPLIKLSTVPTVIDGAVEPRHVDLRPFILQSDRMYVTPGGLTRVALRKGSTVVNSSQGGGSKDTWILEQG
ncbi:putative circularly permuted ATP-grasp superfamily protein [Natronocella acetinitrilica]|uniref:Circularly permuted ATP-grasp superfamily protein n=1 Tax=Natronocella acetinitrilica TaxID=414046 RepID=A0AAE3G1H9_9GAMM|nr:circularly permuted type 2 ATP-grasp protein [Natronocella acetinitrilica]MCP1673478.1 putative circularly permuted ATP-grasp superfamily protein [Natronocella acetinitrilica]